MSARNFSDHDNLPHRPIPTGGGLGNGASGGMNRNLSAAREQALFDVQRRVQLLLVTDLESSKTQMERWSPAQLRREVEERLSRIVDTELSRQQMPLSKADRLALISRCLDDILGYGPIEPLLRDDNVTEIMVNGAFDIWVDRRDTRMTKSDARFQDEPHLMRVIERLLAPTGRRVDEATPLVDARLPNGSRINIVVPPVALDGAKITIRKFGDHPLQPQDLIDRRALSSDMMLFLQRCVEARLNIIVAGGTNTGKSTMLNVLSVFIPSNQRIVTIEDSAELQLQQPHVVRLESRPANVEGKNQITIRHLVANSLRMRPDRIVVGECRGGEALDMLQAMNTGHEGSMTTLHANSAKDVIGRLELLVLQAGLDLPVSAIREQIATAVHLIIQLGHFEDGSRKVVSVSELRRGAGGVVQVEDVFEFQRTGTDAQGKITGRLRRTADQSHILEQLENMHMALPPGIFQRER
jgi:pilus assembly protein CpaF